MFVFGALVVVALVAVAVATDSVSSTTCRSRHSARNAAINLSQRDGASVGGAVAVVDAVAEGVDDEPVADALVGRAPDDVVDVFG